jgi:lipopolysaccharide export LptBFGC system permease protein LptF
MFSVIDRYILRALLVNYLIALGVMLALLAVLDMLLNMDEFTEQGYPLTTVIGNIVSYYVPNLALYFAQLSSVIALFACAATVARMRKLNELTAVLASGVSLYRIARPVLLFGVAVTALLVADTEMVIPSIAHLLARDHDDVDGQRTYEVLFLQDRQDALLSAGKFDPRTSDLTRLLVLSRDAEGGVLSTLEADRATWEPQDLLHPSGRWRLDRARMTTRVRGEGVGFGPREDKPVTHPTHYESDLSPEAIQVRQSEGWIRFLSLSQLQALQKAGAGDAVSIAQTVHARKTAPIVGLVLMVLGLPFFLDRSPANILSDAGKCTVVCGLCYVATFVIQTLRPATVSAFPSWIPIFVFGTLAVVLIDRVRT